MTKHPSHRTSNTSRPVLTKRKRSKEEIILLLMCSLSIPSILPFAIYRLLTHLWLPAAIDMMIVAGVTSVMLYVWVTGKVRAASLIVTIFYSAGMVAAVHINGVGLIYWTYPTMISAFFLLRPNTALAINTASLSALIVILLPIVAPLNLITITITLILINLFSYIFSLRTVIQHNELNMEAERDFLTGTGNRRALEAHLCEYLDNAGQRQESSLLLLDIDYFKRINDEFGHAVGDDVLVRICELIRSRTRAADKIFRYGGEEFIVIADLANIQAAAKLAEELRTMVAGAAIIDNYPITISVGVATMTHGQSPVDWLATADQMLYLAKQSGRNVVKVAGQI